MNREPQLSLEDSQQTEQLIDDASAQVESVNDATEAYIREFSGFDC